MTTPIRVKGGVACVSAEDAELAKSRWRVSVNGYVIRTRGSRAEGRVTEYLHRVVAGRAGFLVDGVDVDHIDGDRLNNTRANLRSATRSQNQQNRRRKRTGASRFKGVSRMGKRWRATIVLAGKQVYLGGFAHEQDAAEAYARAASAAFGAYAAPVVTKETNR